MANSEQNIRYRIAPICENLRNSDYCCVSIHVFVSSYTWFLTVILYLSLNSFQYK